MPVTAWNTVAGNNTSAPPNGAPEGMAPSTVNNVLRQIMADVAVEAQTNAVKVLNTVAGTNTITADMNPELAAYAAGMMIVFTPANTNSGATTIAIDGLAALDIQKGAGIALVSGDLVAGIPALLVLDSGADDFILMNPQGVPQTAASILAALLTVDGAASGLDADLLDGVNSTGYATKESGSFVGTLTGMTGATTGTVYYIIAGGVCTLYLAASDILGTSNAATLTMTGLAAAVRPSGFSPRVICGTRDDGYMNVSEAIVDGAGAVITFYILDTSTVANRLVNSLGSTYTSSGSKGLLGGWSITYPLST